MELDVGDSRVPRGQDEPLPYSRAEHSDRDPVQPAPSLLGVDGLLKGWLIALGASVVAAFVGWQLDQQASRRWHWEGPLAEAAVVPVGSAAAPIRIITRNEADRKNTALAMGILGGAVGLAFGLAGGFVRGARRTAIACGSLGLLLGAAAGAGVSFIMVPFFHGSVSRIPNLMLPLLVHIGLYSSIGATGGMLFGLASGPATAMRGGVGGAMGALLGSIVFNVLHTLAFPLEWDFSPMPGVGASRLMAHLCVTLAAMTCVLIAVGAPAVQPRDATES